MSTLKISGKAPNWAVEIDGHAIWPRSLDLHMDAQSLPQLVITPDIFEVGTDLECKVELPQIVVDTLKALGWTPPGETLVYAAREPSGATKPDMTDDEFERRMHRWSVHDPQGFEDLMERLMRRRSALNPSKIR